MFATHYITDAAVFPARPPRSPAGHEPNEDKAEHRKGGLFASLRAFRASRRGR